MKERGDGGVERGGKRGLKKWGIGGEWKRGEEGLERKRELGKKESRDGRNAGQKDRRKKG